MSFDPWNTGFKNFNRIAKIDSFLSSKEIAKGEVEKREVFETRT